MRNLLEVKNLSIDFQQAGRIVHAVRDVSFSIAPGETLGIVGESGSGKSVTALSVMRLLASPPARVHSGAMWFHPRNTDQAVDLATLPLSAVQQLRGSEISMIFQEPMSSLNPVFRCGDQVMEAVQLHRKVSDAEARSKVLALFERVKLPDPQRVFDAYPHQLSGGQKQRVMIAMAISCTPQLLIADEPTTALDVTVQKTILDLLRDLQHEQQLSMLFISHDLGVIASICDRVIVMREGQIVEAGDVQHILRHPQHPYTKGLIACRPSLQYKRRPLPTVQDFMENPAFEARVATAHELTTRRAQLLQAPPILRIEKLQVRYPSRKDFFGRPTDWLNAVNELSFEVYPGETFGLAGESGCGKTTLGKTIARLQDADSGSVWYKDVDLQQLTPEALLPYRRDIQVVFQDPYASLNPLIPVGEAIMEPMRWHRLYPNEKACREAAIALLETVGLSADHFERFPQAFSGGQRQRICIARALALQPRILICDEIVSALDVSIQATVLNLLADLQEKFGLTYLFISHDLSVVKQMCDRIMVMRDGRVEALGTPEQIFEKTDNDYVQQLIAAIPGV